MKSAALAAYVSALLVVTAQAEDKVSALMEELAGKLKADPASLDSVLARYNKIESEEKLDVFERHDIHQGLLKEIRTLTDPVLAKEAAAVLSHTEKPWFPSRVLILKAVVGNNFPASRGERVAHLVRAAKSKDERLAVWGVRLLGASRWPESIEGLLSILVGEEKAGNFDGFLLTLVHGELFRILGAEATGGGSGKIREAWEKSGMKPPGAPAYELSGPDQGTTAFFGDRVYPRSVFCIDVSGSMRQTAELVRNSGAGRTTVKGGTQQTGKVVEGKPKVDIVREELLKALKGLRPNFKFNVLSYSASCRAWEGKAPLKLVTAKESAVKSAGDWVRKLDTSSGTNIHDALAAALEIPEVETVYLLSDGAPTVGGGAEEIVRRAAALNYLRGARIIAYGFTGQNQEDFDEQLMKRLAKEHWGWYRRLNK